MCSACAKNVLLISIDGHLPKLTIAFVRLVILLIALSCSALASSFDDYHNRVQQSVDGLDALVQSDETDTPEQVKSRIEYTVAAVRSYLPVTETVEWREEKFVAQNQWLHDALKDYQNKSGEEAALALRSLTERLKALAQALAEVKAARESTGLHGEEASAKLKEILNRQEFTTKQDAGNALDRLVRQILRWLSNLMPKRREMSPGSANILSFIAQVFVLILALAVIIYVLWKVIPRVLRGRVRLKKPKAEPRIVLGEKLAPDESAGDLLAEAEALARRGDLRAAIRKGYIALLVELGDRKIVSLAQYKTNRDYLRAVRKTEPLYSSMKSLTESFERHWYGLVGATENDWTNFRAAYHRALAR